MNEQTTRLWQAEVGGAAYWVAATTADEARAVLERDAYEWSEVTDGGRDVTITECTRERGEKLRFVRDDGTRVPMWAEFERDPSPRFIACSEW